MGVRRRLRGIGGAGSGGWSVHVAVVLAALWVSVIVVVGASGAVTASTRLARAAGVARLSAGASTPSPGLSAATPPGPCTVTLKAGGPGNAFVVDSWCIPSITGINGFVGHSLGVYKVDLSHTAEARVTISVPGGGLSAGVPPYPYCNLALEAVAYRAAVAQGFCAQEAPFTCAIHANSCTLVFYPVQINTSASDHDGQSFWMISQFCYYGTSSQYSLTCGGFAVEVVYPPVAKAPPPPPRPRTSLLVAVTEPHAAIGKSVPVGTAGRVTVAVTAVGGGVRSITLGKGLLSSSAAAVVTARPPGLTGFSLPKGASRDFVFKVKAAKAGNVTLSAAANGVSGAGGKVQGAGSLVVKIGGNALLVTVTPKPGALRLVLKGDTLVPRPVPVLVTVKNTGVTSVLGARLQNKLTVGYLGSGPAVAEIPIRPQGLPAPQSLGTIRPGQTVSGTYTVLAKGDGDYSLDALVVGSAPSGGRIAGIGSGELDVSGPVLLMSTGNSSGAALPGMHGLIIAGAPFTIDLSLKNLSYVHKIVVSPFRAALSGNATGGQVVLGDAPASALDQAALPVPPEFLTLDPRQSLKAEIVAYTTQSQGILQNAGKQGVGGTRANVTLPTPAASYVNANGSAGQPVASADIGVNGDTTYQVGIDDSDLYQPQVYKDWLTGNYTGDTLTGAAFFSAGLVNGAANFFSGMVHAIPNLPLLVGQGLVAIPPALYDLAQFEVQLWQSLQNDPVAKLAYTNALTASAYAMYKNAQGFANSSFGKEIVAAENAYFTNLSNLWARDWGAAVEQIGEETGEAVAPIAGPKLAAWFVRGMAPAVLARSAPALKAFAAQQNALYTAFGQQLTARYPRFASALDAISALKDAPPGTPFTDTQIRQLYGLTQRQVSWLRNFAQTQDLLIVCRSRAVDSIAWLNGQVVNGVKWAEAVLKPEAIKLKNVSFEDWQYLGYNESDIGRVVISQHELPTITQVEAKMTANGLTPGSTDWNDILSRLSQREGEFSAPASKGKVKGLIQDAEKGEITMNFNLAGNSVDPSALASAETTYPFRLANEANQAIPKNQLASYKGNMIPEFFVNGQWRCVTGDVDFLQITKGNGAALNDAQRAAVYLEMSRSPVGFMHGESATWTLGAAFDFPEKVNEFVRAGTALQFAPDPSGTGIARAVKFLTAQFTNKTEYVIEWAGGALNPAGAITPP